MTKAIKGSYHLKQFLENNRLPSGQDLIGKFDQFYDTLMSFHKKMNLIGPLSEFDVYDTLFCDSLAVSTLIELPKKIIDVGSGAGFPGIPLALISQALNSDSHFTLVEPRQKRAQFMTIAAHRLGLENVTIVRDRIEHVGEKIYDLAISKAFQPPGDWIKTAISLVKDSGLIAILHTDSGLGEIKQSIEDFHECVLYKQIIGLETIGLYASDPRRSLTIVSVSHIPG